MTRHALLTIALAAASTAAYASLWPFSAFTDDASLSAARTQVTSNGVTRTRLGDLYRDNLVVTDVDLSSVEGTITNIVAGDNIVIDDPAPGVKRISAIGRGGGGRELDDMTVWVRTNGTEFVDTGDRLATTGQVGTVMTFLESHEEYADMMFDNQAARLSGIIQQQGNLNNRVMYTVEPAIEDVSNRMHSCERKVADLVYGFGASMPVDECLKYASLGIPALKCTLATGNTALFVLCRSGVYSDASKVRLPFSDDGPVGAVRDMLGWTFTRADLYRTFGDDIIWTSDFTPTEGNLSKPVSQVCGGIGYPKYYGRESTAFELLCDILATDRKAVLRGDPYLTYQTNSVKFANLRAVSEQLYDYSAAAHSEIIKMRSKVDGIQAPDYSKDNDELVDTISEVHDSMASLDFEAFADNVVYPSVDESVAWANRYTDGKVSTLSTDVSSRLSRKQDALPFTTNSYTNEQGTVVTLTNYAISVEYATDAGSAGYAYWSEGIFNATNNLYASGEIVTITNLDTLASVTNRVATEAHVAMKLSAKANRAKSGHADEIATLDADGNPKASGKTASDFAPAVEGGYLPVSNSYVAFDPDEHYIRLLPSRLQLGSSEKELWQANNAILYGKFELSTEDRELAVKGDISATSAAFSNAVMGVASHTNAAFATEVLAVQVSSLSTNITAEVYIAATNAWASLGIDPALIPQSGTLGTVGGLIIALAAAVYFLKRKTSLLESDGKASETFATGLLSKQVAKDAITASLADPFVAKTSGSYAEGDPVTYDGKLYKRSTEPGDDTSWVSSHWTETTVATLWNNADTTSYGGQN